VPNHESHVSVQSAEMLRIFCLGQALGIVSVPAQTGKLSLDLKHTERELRSDMKELRSDMKVGLDLQAFTSLRKSFISLRNSRSVCFRSNESFPVCAGTDTMPSA